MDPSSAFVYRTRALGTVAEMVVTEGGALVPAVELLHGELERIDRVASRFRADSELSRLNARAGRETPVSDDLFEAVEVALSMAQATEGLVDPTVGTAVHRLGYDRDFAQIAGGVAGALPPARPVPGWRSVTLDTERRTVLVPRGVELDLGATAKALASDRAAAVVARRTGCGALVSLGGDVAVAGPPPPEGFAVGVAEFSTSRETAETLAVLSGGVATSGTQARQWRLGTCPVHHIVDPRTGLPPAPHWRTVTVVASDCVQANAAATAAVVRGRRALDWLAGLGLPARLVHGDGWVARTPAWPAETSPNRTAARPASRPSASRPSASRPSASRRSAGRRTEGRRMASPQSA